MFYSLKTQTEQQKLDNHCETMIPFQPRTDPRFHTMNEENIMWVNIFNINGNSGYRGVIMRQIICNSIVHAQFLRALQSNLGLLKHKTFQ